MKRQLLKFFFTQGTIEEKVYQRQISKQGLSGAVVDAKSHGHVKFSLEDLKVIASAACFLPLHWCVLSTVHSVLSRVLWEKKNRQITREGFKPTTIAVPGIKKYIICFLPIHYSVLSTVYSILSKVLWKKSTGESLMWDSIPQPLHCRSRCLQTRPLS